MSKWLPYMLIVFSTFFWGSTFILVKASIQIIAVNYFLALRFSLATLLITPLILYRKRFNQILLWKQGIILGLFLFSSFYFQTVGLLFTTPSNAAFITGLNIVFIPVVGYFLFKTKVTKLSLLSVTIALLGTMLMTLNFDTLRFNTGDLIILLTAISIAFHVLFAERYIVTDLLELLWIQFITMTTCAWILTIFTKELSGTWYTSRIVVFSLLVTVIFATIFAFAAQFYAQQQKVSATIIGILFTLEPIFALIIDILVGIHPSLQTLLGMVLIFVAIILVTLHQPPAEQIEEEILVR